MAYRITQHWSLPVGADRQCVASDRPKTARGDPVAANSAQLTSFDDQPRRHDRPQTAFRLRSSIAFLVTATLFACNVSGAHAQTRTLRFVTQNPPGHPTVVGMEKFAQIVTAKSAGRIKVNIFPGGQLGSSAQSIQQVQVGVVDIAVVNSSLLASQVREFSVYDFPFMVTNTKEAEAVVDGPFGKGLHDRLAQRGIVGLAYWELGFQNITNNKRPIKRLEDVGGLKMRVAPTPINMDWVTAVGAQPTPIAFGEVYAALERGVVDAQESPAAVIDMGKYYHVQKFLSVTNHQYIPQSVIFSGSVWNTLSSQDKKILSDAAVEAGQVQRVASRTQAFAALENLKKNGMQVTELSSSELDRFRNKVKPAIDKQAAAAGIEPTVQAMRAALTTDGGIIGGGGGGGGPTSPPTSLAPPQWNAWFQRDEKVVERLELRKDYRFVLDISRLSRKSAATATLSASAAEEIETAQSEVNLKVRVMLIGGVVEAERAGIVIEQPFQILIEKLRKVDLTPDEQKRWQAGALSTKEYHAKASGGQMTLGVSTIGTGCGSVVISIWDGTGLRPLDHLVYDFQVGNSDSCPTEGRLQAGAESALSISSRGKLEAAQKADAVFHIFEFSPNSSKDEGSIVWFVDRHALTKARTENGSVGGVYAWRTESSVKLYVQKDLPSQIAGARAAAMKAVIGENPYGPVADRLRKKIFTVKEPVLDGPTAQQAENAFARLINESSSEAVILARLAATVDELDYVPLGLLSARTDKPFFTKSFITVQPLPRERFHGGKVCVDPWTLGVPVGLQGLTTPQVVEQLKNFSLGAQQSGRFGLARTIETLGSQLNKSATARASRGEGLVVLSHHANGQLWFGDMMKGLDSGDFSREFLPGSVALLSACSIAGDGPFANKLIDRLNTLNVDTMIVSPFPVNADFGTLLALNFIREVSEAYSNKRTPTIAELYSLAWKATVAQLFKLRDRNLYEMGLEFVLLGDPSIRLCAD